MFSTGLTLKIASYPDKMVYYKRNNFSLSFTKVFKRLIES